jgi:hydrogenase nickel incorporation protein HypA/HybF
MHELGIASAVLEAVRSEAALHPGARVVKFGIRVGALSGVNADALSFCLEALAKDTDLAAAALTIEEPRRRHRCAGCEETFEVEDYDFACPRCGTFQAECVGGTELEVAWLELEEA